MLPNSFGNPSSSVSYSSYTTRYESYSSNSRFETQPISTHRNEEVQKVEAQEKTSRADGFNVKDLVDQIWGFASARIAQAEANGASEDELNSMWEAAESGVEQGFGEAREVLDELGELDEPLQMKIDSAYGQIMDKLQDRSTQPDEATPTQVVASAPEMPTQNVPSTPAVDRAVSVYQYERQTFALDLTTKEGDQILIRSVTEESANLEDSRFGRTSSTQWQSSQSSGYQLIIKGDLNEQESADLDALLAEVNDLAYEFYEGDYDTAFNMATELNIDGTSLKTLDLSMKEVEAKGVGVYSEMSGKPASLPQGLAPLREYAEKLIAAQEKWEAKLNSPNDFLQTLSNHPMNNGGLNQTARLLIG